VDRAVHPAGCRGCPARRGEEGARYLTRSPLAGRESRARGAHARAAYAGAGQGTTLDSQTATLVSLLHALKSEHRIVDPKEHGLTRKELATRAEEISPGDWASEAVREAIEALTAAVIFGDQVRRI